MPEDVEYVPVRDSLLPLAVVDDLDDDELTPVTGDSGDVPEGPAVGYDFVYE